MQTTPPQYNAIDIFRNLYARHSFDCGNLPGLGGIHKEVDLAPCCAACLSVDRIWFGSALVPSALVSSTQHSALNAARRAGTDDYRPMGGVHFSCAHNLGVSASAVLLALFAHYQGAEVAAHSV